MPEASIVIKSTGRYSDTVKAMIKVTNAFGKDVDGLKKRLYSSNVGTFP